MRLVVLIVLMTGMVCMLSRDADAAPMVDNDTVKRSEEEKRNEHQKRRLGSEECELYDMCDPGQ